MRENRPYGSEGGEAKSLPYPYQAPRNLSISAMIGRLLAGFAFAQSTLQTYTV